MDKAFVLLSELSDQEGSTYLAQRLSRINGGAAVFCFFPDFITLLRHSPRVPNVVPLLCNIEENVNINKELVATLPHLELIINYSGDSVTETINRLANIRVTGLESMTSEFASFGTIHTLLSAHQSRSTSLSTLFLQITEQVRERNRFEVCLESLPRAKDRKEWTRAQERGEAFMKFKAGVKYRLPPSRRATPSPVGSTDTAVIDNIPMDREQSVTPSPTELDCLFLNLEIEEGFEVEKRERERRWRERQAALYEKMLQEEKERSFLGQLLRCLTCTGGFPLDGGRRVRRPAPLLKMVFDSEEGIRNFVRGEHLFHLRRNMAALWENAEMDWLKVMTRVDERERWEVAMVRAERERKWKLERKRVERELVHLGRQRESWVRLAMRREAKWRLDAEMHASLDKVRSRMGCERWAVEREFYQMWLRRQLGVLRRLREKADSRWITIFEDVFGTSNSPVPLNTPPPTPVSNLSESEDSVEIEAPFA